MCGMRALCETRLMNDIISLNNFYRRQENYFDIEPKRLPLKIFTVKTYFLLNRKFITTIYLGPSGQSWHQLVNAVLGSQRDQIVLVEQRWPWTHKAHVTNNNAPELR